MPARKLPPVRLKRTPPAKKLDSTAYINGKKV